VRFDPTPIPGAHLVASERATDDRGWFARSFDREAFAAQGLMDEIVHVNRSYNTAAGTLRGLHLQAPPHEEAKVVSCIRGAAYDVIVDLRPDSAAHRRWFAVELREGEPLALFVPAGVAHGFQALEDGTELLYLMSAPYAAEAARGVRWDDPAFAIEWPAPPVERVMSARDRDFPDYTA
jgi:dTDP-4-dehydrorhamnose 3,5-epimerase